MSRQSAENENERRKNYGGLTPPTAYATIYTRFIPSENPT
jgi:hypothetical protein